MWTLSRRGARRSWPFISPFSPGSSHPPGGSLLLVAALLLAAGCGDPDVPDPSPTPDDSPAAQAPVLELDTSAITFGEVTAGDSAEAHRQVHNAGTADLTIEAGIEGDGFSITQAGPLTLAPDQSATLTVTFSPGSSGEFAGTLTVTSNDEDHASSTILLSGVGLAAVVDSDGDGSPAGEDCDDEDADRYPEANERCDGKDNDCDDESDEGVLTTFHPDDDDDGYGLDDPAGELTGCEAPLDYVTDGSDCDDQDLSIHPGADEQCDGRDNNCDGQIDETVLSTFYRDADGDGFGTEADPTAACAAPEGYVAVAGDCDDTRADSSPTALEACDGLDNDCDLEIDEEVTSPFYADSDRDGHGDPDSTPVQACAAPEGYAASADDCLDSDLEVYPGALEACDGKDNDCDEQLDEEGDTTFYRDADGDGHGDLELTIVGCQVEYGYVSAGDDCDDDDPSVYPGRLETCNAVDDDCDGEIDEEVKPSFYRDADGDGYGNAADSRQACDAPDGYVATADDCDDSEAAVHPGAAEACNLADDDCDGEIDEAVQSIFYRDGDGDGHGSSETTRACSAPEGYVASSDDCDDRDPASYPDAPEVCDSKDNDCDDTVDEEVKIAWYLDADDDGYGRSSSAVYACTAPTPAYVDQGGDCNDSAADSYPDAPELCDGKDNDCDNKIDEEVTLAWYLDRDSDGYGDPASSSTGCTAPPSYVSRAGDCNDFDAAVSPAATEVCNDRDDDCDGTVDGDTATDRATWYADSDSDGFGDPSSPRLDCDRPAGYLADSTDCDDTKSTVHPGAAEYCNEIDDDCDGTTDEDAVDPQTFYQDSDSDGYGASSSTTRACALPAGYSAERGDCDDSSPSVHPTASETCNETDDDCDELVDEIESCLTTVSGSQQLNRYTWLTEDVSTGTTELPVNDASAFAAGDLVLLVQVQGDPTGWFELAEVEATASGYLLLSAPLGSLFLAGPYNTGGAYATQVVKVARFNNLVLDGASISAPAWNGYTGGIVAIEARYDITFQGGSSINVDALGFRGPARETGRQLNGRVGEGVFGNTGTRCATEKTLPDTGTGGCGAVEGNYHSFDGVASAGGGANETTPPANGNPYPDRYRAKDGIPYGVDDPEVLLFGGGGGQGDSGTNDWNSLARGGNGGGMIFLWARSVTGIGTLSANGGAGEQGCDYNGSGGDWGVSGGGGGAGGSIRIDASSVGALTIRATGGAGNNICYHTSYYSNSGGAGRVVIYADTVSASSNPARMP